MSKILVSGLTNIEVTVAVDKFPVEYRAIDYSFFGVNSAPSGVGLNISTALSTLGDSTTLLSLCGSDIQGENIKNYLSQYGINTSCILPHLKATPQSVVLYDKNGKRNIFCDLKDAQETEYDMSVFEREAKNCDAMCLCNINFSRKMLPVAKSMNKPIISDVHVISCLDDEYNYDFMMYADILFLSNENISNPRYFIRDIEKAFGNSVIIMGMGSQGSLLYTKSTDTFYEIPAVRTRKVVNTVGAGDALLSAFTHFYIGGYSAQDALRLASLFASYKIGDKSASGGFLTEQKLLEYYTELNMEQ